MSQLDTERMQSIAQGLPTKSAKIRALSSAGFSRSDIAGFLNIRYQHVRNVQVRTERKTENIPRSAHLEVGAGGRVVIPAAFRDAMNIKEGDRLVAKLENGELRLMSKQLTLRRAQEIIRRHVPAGVSLVDELIADRRREAALERGPVRKPSRDE